MGLRSSIAVFVISLLVSLVILAPMSIIIAQVDRQTAADLPVTRVQGTLWSGEAVLTYQNTPLSLQWQYEFPFTWQLALDNNQAGELMAQVLPWSQRIERLNGEINAAWLVDQIEPYLGGPLLDAPGYIDLSGFSMALEDGQVALASGLASYDGGTATYNLFSDQAVEVPPLYVKVDTTQTGIRGELVSDDDVPLASLDLQGQTASYQVSSLLLQRLGFRASGPEEVILQAQAILPKLGY